MNNITIMHEYKYDELKYKDKTLPKIQIISYFRATLFSLCINISVLLRMNDNLDTNQA